AALHTLLPGVIDNDRPALLPFSWSGVTLHAVGATTLRVRLTLTGPQTASLTLTDPTGNPVATIDALDLRPLNKEALRQAAATTQDGLLRPTWTPVPANNADDAAAPTPVLLTIDASDAEYPEDSDLPQAVRNALHATLHTVQDWLTDEQSADSTLTVVTQGALATTPGEPITNLTHA
uniref:polyketide synthase dehydratase domain-containing protein n=1 Tax=Streptomyces apocyni TaxID=2654677 RepID=UPI0012EAD8A9